LIVDTSSLIAILLGEPDAARHAAALRAASVVRISAATLVEAFVIANAARATSGLQQMLGASGARVEPFTARQADLAAAAYSRYGRGSGHAAHLNFGDTFAYALAMDLDEPLLFKGDDFSRTDVRSAL
jgi:ribonuclease VapC